MRLCTPQHVTARTTLQRHPCLVGTWNAADIRRRRWLRTRCAPPGDGQQSAGPLPPQGPVDAAAEAVAAAPSYVATGPIQSVLVTPPETESPITDAASDASSSNGSNGSNGSVSSTDSTNAASNRAPATAMSAAAGKAAVLPSSSYPIEVKRIMGLALPLALQNVAGFSLSVICAASIGRLGPMHLAASVLANSLYNVTGYSIAMGLSAGMETQCGQAYGAKNYKTVGLVLQRALLVCWSVCIPVAVLWLNSGRLLVALGQERDISMLAGRYLAMCIPCLFLGVAMECIKKYLQTQRVVKPTMIIAAITTALSPLYFWALVFKAGLGLDGAAFAFISCQLTSLGMMLAYVFWRTKQQANRPDRTWGGWSKDAFKGWGTYLSYGLPAAAMICMEWWAFEVIVLMAGVLPDAKVALSVMGICLQITAWVYMLPAGLASAVNTCMSAALGAGHAASARRIFRVSLLCALGLQAMVISGVLLGKELLVKLFCSDPTVIARALDVLPVLAGLMLCDGICATVSGVLRGAGRQMLGAAINAVGYWAVGIPLSWLLSFKADLGIHGLWLGLGCGGLVQAITLVVMVWRWDWQQEVERVKRLLQDLDGAPMLATGH